MFMSPELFVYKGRYIQGDTDLKQAVEVEVQRKLKKINTFEIGCY
jgi:hypothetical protein